MRELTDHKTNPANAKLTITVCDEPGAGGANHLYRISGFADRLNPVPAAAYHEPAQGEPRIFVLFQYGQIAENGVNGVTDEALLAIVIDRLRSFQAGPYSCMENEVALSYLQGAMKALHVRTTHRIERGVEGTSQP